MSCPRPRTLTTSEWLRNMRIRELQLEDLATRVQWMNAPRVYGSMHFDVPIVMENTIRWFERIRGSATRSDVVFTDDEDRIVGFGGLTSISESPRMAGLYVFVNPAFQQRGLGTQATLFADMLADHYGIEERYGDRILFCTDYLCGGYEQFSPEMEEYLTAVMKSTGLMFDTTYSGKAFFGMMDIVKKQSLSEKNILFWHTGGLMNIMR